GLFLGLDFTGDTNGVVGYRAKRNSRLLDLCDVGGHDPKDYWEPVTCERGDQLVLEPEEFYLLLSAEAVSIPREFAAEMAAYDPTSGELRTHYAGFFDPGFGDVPERELRGTPAVLEVRAHDIPFALEHGQRLCKLTFERMAGLPDEAYGAGIGSRYQRQYLTLSRQFLPDQAGIPKPRRLKGVVQSPLSLVAGGAADQPPLPVSRRE
ncbi:MAG TPA: 2'-deoxycytidine 5'-triphosphate deaminase, partial [Candidatus Limnocylindrales bacterium]|nr:2'-deoxycytidine 5'-triphosphate deaminase [Candidatus Limnocylindrales bacterium]